HGATIGQLSADALFYLRSRGINLETARNLLTYAFANDVTSRIKIKPIRTELENILFSRLPQNERLILRKPLRISLSQVPSQSAKFPLMFTKSGMTFLL